MGSLEVHKEYNKPDWQIWMLQNCEVLVDTVTENWSKEHTATSLLYCRRNEILKLLEMAIQSSSLITNQRLEHSKLFSRR